MNRQLKLKIALVLLAGLLVGLASLLPLVWAEGQPMPGFAYSPFYTTNIFSDASLNSYTAGLRPEDRVIQVNRQRIDQLTPLASSGGELYLTYELKQALVTIYVQSQDWTVIRLLEKSGPLLITGVWLIWLAVRLLLKKPAKNKNWLTIGLGLVGLALLTAPDFFLSPGAGRESGFDFVAHWQNGEYLAVTAKWSSYFYFPLWTVAAFALNIFLLQNLLAHVMPKFRRWAVAVTLLLLCLDLGNYLFSALHTMRYNNPDYIVLHVRGEFWLLWPLVLILTFANGIKKWQSSISHRQAYPKFLLIGEGLSLTLFVVGFIAPTVFDWQPPGVGAQWYAILAAVYFELVEAKAA